MNDTKLNRNFPRLRKQGLYDPAHEHDACGIGFVADIKGRRSHDIVRKGLAMLVSRQEDLFVVAEAGTVVEAVKTARE